MEWTDSFSGLLELLGGRDRPTTAVIGVADRHGTLATSFAERVRASTVGTAIVVCCDAVTDASVSTAALSDAGVHDILFTGMGDDSFVIRTIILGAALGGAGDRVMVGVRSLVPRALLAYMEAAVRRPRELQRVSDLAASLHIPRQTLARWCRDKRYASPEELLVWARLFLVATLLETTPWTLEAIAREMAYGSPAALRNRIRAYTGSTATEMRSGGLDFVLRRFVERVDQLRGAPFTEEQTIELET